MRIHRDVAVPVDDGVVLRADVLRPDDGGAYPTLLSYGPYAMNQWQVAAASP